MNRFEATPLNRVTQFWVITAVPAAFVVTLFQNYFFIYATDILLLAPAAVGALVALARFYDGISDIAIASWSDRSRHPFGRRKVFILLGGLMAISYAGIWLPPEQLPVAATVLWLALALIIFETADTLRAVPMLALGMEAGATPARRSRFIMLGLVAGLPFAILANLFMQHLIDSGTARETAAPMIMVVSIILAAAIIVPGLRLCEPPLKLRDNPPRFAPMLKQVLGIGYHRRLLGVQLAETVGFASLAFSIPYVMTYVMDRSDSIGMVMIVYLALYALSQPLWTMLIPRLGMKRIWLTGLTGWLVVFALIPVAVYTGLPALIAVTVLAGLSGGASVVMFAMLGDIADYDARQTGHERQAIYASIYRLVQKIGGAAIAFVLGLALQFSGFVANAEQPVHVTAAIMLCASVLPFIGIGTGFLLLRRYDFYAVEGVSDGREDKPEWATLPSA